MTETTYANDNLNDFEKPKLPTTLNVITILTIIWCILMILGAGWGFISAKGNYEKKDEAIAKMQTPNMPAWAKAMIPDPEKYDIMVTKNYENRIPILLLSLIANGLCLVGAFQMRKLKKQGYLLYMIGELLPFFTTVFFIGTFMLTGMGAMIGIGITVLFIMLYTAQRKHLVY